MYTRAGLAVLLTVALPPLLARADFAGRLNVDFNESPPTFQGVPSPTYVGPAVVGGATDVWNGVSLPFSWGGETSVSGIPLVSSGGSPTPVTLAYRGTGAYSAIDRSPFLGTPLESLLRDYLYANRADRIDPPGMLGLSGLTPNGTYDLYLYGASDGPKGTVFRIGDEQHAAVFSNTVFTLTEGVNYVRFRTSANDGGNITVAFDRGGGFDGVVNGLQLQFVPEPGCGMLALLGATALRRRRRGGP